MSKRNHPQQKKLRKLRHSLRATPRAYINLVDWLRDRGYARTAGEAKRLILDGRVIAESHPLGVLTLTLEDGRKVRSFEPCVPAKLRGLIQVKEAE